MPQTLKGVVTREVMQLMPNFSDPGISSYLGMLHAQGLAFHRSSLRALRVILQNRFISCYDFLLHPNHGLLCDVCRQPASLCTVAHVLVFRSFSIVSSISSLKKLPPNSDIRFTAHCDSVSKLHWFLWMVLDKVGLSSPNNLSKHQSGVVFRFPMLTQAAKNRIDRVR